MAEEVLGCGGGWVCSGTGGVCVSGLSIRELGIEWVEEGQG